ncbi:MAG: 2-thiouracil desulfurase family protein [Candidatus Omnitrophota bacterium]
MRIVSACLLGVKCRYDGRSRPHPGALRASRRETLVPVCPEQLGGLGTPREKAEIAGLRVVTESGGDVTANFTRGAEETLRIAKMFKARVAVLKSKSASCGSGRVYDGTFTGRMKKGDGVTAALLKKNGIRVVSESAIKLAALLIIAVLGAGQASGDVIHLKSGGKVRGAVKEKQPESVLVDLGFGLTSISDEEIESIDYDDEHPSESDEAPAAPGGAEEPGLMAELRHVKRLRSDAIRYRNKHEAARRSVVYIDREIFKLYSQLKTANDELTRTDPKQIVKYNKAVSALNALNARGAGLNRDAAAARDRESSTGRLMSEKVAAYGDALNALRAKVSGLSGSAGPDGAGADSYGRGVVIAELDRLEDGFSRTEVEYSDMGPDVVVTARLDGRIDVRMVVDTGANILLITEDVARRLGLDIADESAKIQCVLADGSRAMARPCVISSVDVGGRVVRDVAAAVIGSSPMPGLDGLLGMSFLNNFIVRIDPKGKRLVLEEFSS